MIAGLKTHGLRVEHCTTVRQTISKLQEPSCEYALIIVHISDACQPWLRLLHSLREVVFQSAKAVAGPLFLCVSTVRHDHLFELQIERMGARFVYE